MLGDKVKVQSKVVSDYTDEQLRFIKQMGVKYVYVIFKDEHTSYDAVMRCKERLAHFGLEITDAGNTNLYKNDKIHLGLPGRDEAIEAYNNFNIILGKAGIPVVYMTWEPNAVLTTRFAEGKYTRGGIAGSLSWTSSKAARTVMAGSTPKRKCGKTSNISWIVRCRYASRQM